MTTFSSRLDRLERHRAPDPGDPFGLQSWTEEQLLIGLLDICRLELEDLELTTVRRSEIETKISEIEDRIRKTANMWADPRCEPHRQRVRGMWTGAKGAVGELVPPLFDGDIWWDWVRPKRIGTEMRWRREIRARPDIAALIAEGEAQAARQAETTARPGIAPAVVRVARPPDPEPAIAVPSVPEPVAPALMPVAYPTTPEAPARGSFVADNDPYREFRPRW